MPAVQIAIGRGASTHQDFSCVIEEVAIEEVAMTVVWITITAYWLVTVLFMMALCRAAARGDTVLA